MCERGCRVGQLLLWGLILFCAQKVRMVHCRGREGGDKIIPSD